MKKEQSAVEFKYNRSSCFVLHLLAAVMLIGGLIQIAHAAPEDGVVRAGSAKIVEQGSTTLIRQSSQRAVIDWRGFSINSNEQVRFAQPSAGSATLNRVTGNQVSMILGRMDANGHVLLINPNGIIFGKGAQINVGSLIASTANLSNDNFMQGKLVFDQPGQPGAGIINAGSITATEGGLVALVAPHVRNDGLIQARLGKVMMGSADTFTIDLYGDGLIKLALSDDSLAQLRDPRGEPVKSLISQSGVINVGSGQAVLVTAETAKGMLDSLINMSGVILAESAVQEGGRILLFARGGNVDVSGELRAGGTKGGRIEVLGDQVHLASSAELDADGTYGGGTLHIGGDYQGGGETYRSVSTEIDNGAILNAGALTRGDGGEVVVWSDGHTAYDGSIQARGGAEGGDGGLVEVSGKRTLFFNGLVDAGASYGKFGSLLLDPYDFTIGMTEAGLINRVLRTGTSTAVSADNDLYVNYAIDGRGRYAGGGLTLSAGNNLNVNDHIITNNGAVNLFATAGGINLAPDKVMYSGTAPITMRSSGTLSAPSLVGGSVSLTSDQGAVNINPGGGSLVDKLLIRAKTDVSINQLVQSRSDGNAVDISAGHDVNISAPIVSTSNGNTVSVIAGNDINVNGQIDGRPSLDANPNGEVTMTAGQNINLYKSVLANSINMNATLGTINAPTMKAGTVTLDADGIPHGEGLFAGTGPISVVAGGDLSSGVYVTTGPVSIRSTGGNVTVDTKLAEILGNVAIKSDTGSVNIDQEITNIRSGSNLEIIAGADINLNRQIDGRPSLDANPNGEVTMTAGQNINLYKSVLANSINMNATLGTINAPTMKAGTVTLDADGIPHGEGLFAGTGPISVVAGGDLSSGIYVTTGPVSIRSTGGDVNVDTKLAEILGNVTIKSDTGSVNIDQEIANIRSGSNLTITAGADINLNRQIDALDDSNPHSIIPVPGGSVTFAAGNNINLNKDLVTYNGPVNITATNGTLDIAWDSTNNRTYRIQTGSAPITVTTGGNLSTGTAPPTTFARDTFLYPTAYENIVGELKKYVAFNTTGKLSLTSTGGDVTVDAPIPNTTGEVVITASDAIIVNHKVLSNNQPITLIAGSGGITVNPTDDNYGILSHDVKRPAIDSGSGPLTLKAAGDISITPTNGIATSNTLTIDTRSKILQGAVNEYVGYRPSKILLNADKGINSFYAGSSPIIEAMSSNGAIKLTVYDPGQLTIKAPSEIGDVSVYGVFGKIGKVVDIAAGRDIGLSDVKQEGGTLVLSAGRDANLYHLMLSSLDVTASSIYFNSRNWQRFPNATVWLEGGNLTATTTGLVANPDRPLTTGDILFNNYSAVHIGGGKSLTLDADKSMELGFLESLGPVSITAQTGDIKLRNDIGPPIRFYIGGNFYKYGYYLNNNWYFSNDNSDPRYTYISSLDPDGIGVASLLLDAGGNIDMEGAKAAGAVTITAGGTLTPTRGIYSAPSKLNITTQNVTVVNGTSFGVIPLGAQEPLQPPGFESPIGSPGPAVAPPGLPGALTALAAQPPDISSAFPTQPPDALTALAAQPPDISSALPAQPPDALTALAAQPSGMVDVSGSKIPGASGADGSFSESENAILRTGIGGNLSEIIPDDDEKTDEEDNNNNILKIAGGRGIAQETDFGRR